MGTPSSIIGTFILEIATGGAVIMVDIVPVTLLTVLATPLTGLVTQAIVPVTLGTFVLPLLLREHGHPILRLVLP
jgi:hypothetical protein